MMDKTWSFLKKELKNYCEENNFSEVMLGLSGGLDSAMVCALAADAIGGENVYAYMMKTKYTSQLSLDIARKIASNLCVNFQEIDINPLIEQQEVFFNQVMGEKPKKIVLENLQARERGKILMTLSNQYNRLVLACGNKSEAAMGYCTLYGDTCGGVEPIGDVYKSDLFELAKWRNSISKVLPDDVINRAPSAELSEGQKDEDSLPPYKILDAILRFYLDDNLSKNQIISLGFDEEIVNFD